MQHQGSKAVVRNEKFVMVDLTRWGQKKIGTRLLLLLKSLFYKGKLENPSAFKISSNGPHICALDTRKNAAHLRKF